MRKSFVSIALAVLALTPTIASAASDRDAVMSTIHRWVDASNKSDRDAFLALCATQTTILDDFSPYQWQGADACSSWWSDARKDADMTDFMVKVGMPIHISINNDHAYVITRDSVTFKMKGMLMRQTGSIHTFVLDKNSAAWRISASAWADTSPAKSMTDTKK